ncbi:site-2 protease family protein [Streptomonospora salina]|uniref:Zinc metalloprotease n=1 Tax=Streptomonospora salina TaxID=104205 RepID=A0A841E782_9ACTN|nr:site-2 protease family protein [Streptomonospora salina]MBB5996420.1 Zn-dependent protease [Streptomonospora salina]
MTHSGSSTPPESPSTARSTRDGSGWLMARPFGIPVYVTPSWLIIAAVITLIYEPVVERTLHLGPLSYVVAFVFAVLLYASVLIHELAHCVTARMFGLPVARITLYMLGGLSQIEREAPTPGREFLVAVSGPVLSLALAAAGFAGYWLVDPQTVVGVLVWQLWVANLLVGVFNLLPGLPLDGGRLVRAAVWALTRRPYAGTVVAAWGGRLLAVAIVAVPVLYGLATGSAPDLFGMVWAVLLASFMWMGAASALRAARVRERVPTLRARRLGRRVVAVGADTSVAEARRRMEAAGARAVVVADTAGTPTSIVNEAAAAAVPDTRLPWVPVSSVARAITSGAVVGADLEGEELLEALRAHPAQEYLLVEADGSVYGALYTSDIQQAFVRR